MTFRYLLFFVLTISSQMTIAQNEYEQRLPAKKSVVPKAVLNTFNEQYPDVLVKGWYATHITYWYNDVSSGWYSDWYGTRPVVVYTYEKPNYFEVEFVGEYGGLSRSIYNRFGHWYETRTQLRGLPLTVMEALKQTKYADWKRSFLVEKIESDSWMETIYRFRMHKGLKSRIIRMNTEGQIIQERDISN